MPTINIKPFTRVEGHLDIEVTVELSGGVQQVVDAKSGGMMFRGFEAILQGRDPLDAVIYTQRICGVCPISHAMAATKALEAACGVAPADNGRIMRNLVLGANFVQSHILHFYHLAALGLHRHLGHPGHVALDAALHLAGHDRRPDGGHAGQPLRPGPHDAPQGPPACGHFRRPHAEPANFTPGGSTETVESGAIAFARTLLTELRDFINNVMLPDVHALGATFPQYAGIGAGPATCWPTACSTWTRPVRTSCSRAAGTAAAP